MMTINFNIARSDAVKTQSAAHTDYNINFNRKENIMFPFIRLAMQAFLKPYSLGDKTSCKQFIEHLLALVKPMAAQTKTELDDKIIRHLEYVLKTDALFDWFYKLVVDQFSTSEIVFEDVNEVEVISMVEQSSSEPLPEAINPIVIVSLVTQIVSLINQLKKLRLE